MLFAKVTLLWRRGNALIFCFSVGRPPRHPREPRGNGTVWVFLFSPRGRVVVLFWKRLRWTTGTYPRDLFEFWSAVYYSTPKFWRAILFHFDAKFRYYVVGVHTSPSREGLFVINFYALCPGTLKGFFCHEKQFPVDIPGVDSREAADKCSKCQPTHLIPNFRVSVPHRWGIIISSENKPHIHLFKAKNSTLQRRRVEF